MIDEILIGIVTIGIITLGFFAMKKIDTFMKNSKRVNKDYKAKGQMERKKYLRRRAKLKRIKDKNLDK